MKTTRILAYFLFTSFVLLSMVPISSCERFCDWFCDNDSTPPDGNGDTYCFWLAAVQDAHVTSLMPDFNNDGAFSLVCSHGEPNGENRSYIQFFMPQFPGTVDVIEAYVNVYEDSQQQPGNDNIEVGTGVAEWDAFTLTWNNQPNPPGSLGPTDIGPYTSMNIWRATEDVKDIVQDHLDNPGNNFGWVLNHTAINNYTRSFKSMNALDARTQTGLGPGPRLLMKVESDTPLTAANIGTVLTGNNELGNMYGTGVDILVYRISQSEEWPTDWEVATR